MRNTGRGLQCYFKASYGILLRNDKKQLVVCVIAQGKEVTSWPSTFNAINEEMQAEDELSALVVTNTVHVSEICH